MSCSRRIPRSVADRSIPPSALSLFGTGRALARSAISRARANGTPRGLLFPATPDFSRDSKFLFVTSLALDLRLFGAPAVDSQFAAQVKRYTISKIRARILA